MSAAESSLSAEDLARSPADLNGRPAKAPELQDRHLVDRCLSGEDGAWDELYAEHHDRLVASIRLIFGQRQWDPNLVEEIAARVWFSIVSNGGELLDRFDPTRQCRLSTFLMVIAKSQANTIFRSERRRRRREQVASRPESDAAEGLDRSIEFAEFLSGLRPSERDFLAQVLKQSKDGESASTLSDTNRWKLNSRILARFKQYFKI